MMIVNTEPGAVGESHDPMRAPARRELPVSPAEMGSSRAACRRATVTLWRPREAGANDTGFDDM